MNKKIIPIISIVLIIIVVGVVVFVIVPGPKLKLEEYYTLVYKTSYSNDTVEYESMVITNTNEYNKFIKGIKNDKYKKVFSNRFFKQYDLLIVNGGISSKLENLEVNKDSVKATVYYATPESTADQEFTRQIYLVPINKDIKDVKVTRTVYPDRVY